MINVTRTYLPPLEKYEEYLKQLWENRWVTNNGKFVQQLEDDLKKYLGVKHFFFCTNGTVVLQMAIKALRLKGQIITTPFSYVATVNSILWENCEPVFVDIKSSDCCIDESKIEASITDETSAILATHVYGNPCDVEAIKKIADKHKLKVIYDGAHAFGTVLNGKQLLSYGDISTCSFHATKLFHTIEGGGIMTNDDEIARHRLSPQPARGLADRDPRERKTPARGLWARAVRRHFLARGRPDGQRFAGGVLLTATSY